MKKLLLLVVLAFLSITIYAQKIEKVSDTVYKITGDNYVATTEAYFGGYLGSFQVDGEEFLENSVVETKGCAILGGVYTYPPVAKVDKIDVVGNKLILTTAQGIMTYEAFPDRLETTVTPVEGSVCFFFLNSGIKLCKVDNKYFKVPFMDQTKGDHIWIKNKAGIKTSGDCTYWGAWHKAEIADLSGGSSATKKFVITPVKLSDADIKKFEDNPLDTDLYLYSPLNYEVFQRETKNNGKILISGQVSPKATNLSYRITGKDLNNKSFDTKWVKMKSKKSGEFSIFAPCNAGGWYKVEVKYTLNNKEEISTVDKVGVGEIIISAGQSNACNASQFKTKTETGMVSNTNGVFWRLAEDPQMGVHDGSGGGSFYPSMGDALYKEFNVPIGVVPTGWGGTAIAKWMPNAEAIPHSLIKPYFNDYDFMMTQVYKFGQKGFRCILWHQGESDFDKDADYYYNCLQTIVFQSRKDAGWNIPWFTAQATYLNDGVGVKEKIREGQKRIWDMGVAYQGPDTDIWLAEYRDNDGKGVHFSKEGLKLHGEAWAKIIAEYIHEDID